MTISYTTILRQDFRPLSELEMVLSLTRRPGLGGDLYRTLAQEGEKKIALNTWPWGPHRYVFFEQKNRLVWEWG